MLFHQLASTPLVAGKLQEYKDRQRKKILDTKVN